MAFFPDLSPYTYCVGEQDVLNVGWLSSSMGFTRGPVPNAFAMRLELLLMKPCRMMRGLHCCEICIPPADILEIDPKYVFVWERARSGSGEVRVKSASGIVYAAPTLVLHYVTEHQYQPPHEFIEAVMYAIECPSSQPNWDEREIS
jgi:hypothetical protein